MIRKVLLCCRGEIALRFIRACRCLGLETAIIHAPEDANAPFVRAADHAHMLESSAADGTGAIPAILAAAVDLAADAVCPGYGPLAENAEFAAACEEAGLIFVGPNTSAIRRMGDKAEARLTAQACGVPVITGSDGPIDTDQALALAECIGFPVIVKAVLGGGGRGIRVAHSAAELRNALQQVRLEAQTAFGRADVYLEQFLPSARHIEVQILGDKLGHIIHLGDRDCSVQRKNQKVIEEAPAPNLAEAVRQGLYEAALSIGRHIGYDSAGTVEFLVVPDGRFAFLEMNTRIQVEHAVTEEVMGIDIVREMLLIAGGASLSICQEAVRPTAHAIELRLCSEDAANDFTADFGTVVACAYPQGPGVRVDAGVAPGSQQSVRFDNLWAKLIVRGRDRGEALSRLANALDEIGLLGFKTNIPLLRWVLGHPEFRAGTYDLNLVRRQFRPEQLHCQESEDTLVAAALIVRHLRSRFGPGVEASSSSAIPWQLVNGFSHSWAWKA